jgi:DNA-binding NarL/FixJ family response regulator
LTVRSDLYTELPELVAAALTKRERDIAILLLCAMENNEIGKELGIKGRTVKANIQRMWLKTQTPGKCNRVVLAMKLSGVY